MLSGYEVICLGREKWPANVSRWPNAGLLLAHRLQRWPVSKPTLAQRLMSAG